MVTLDENGWLGSDARLLRGPADAIDLIEHGFVLDMSAARQRAWKILPDPSPHLLLTMPRRTHEADEKEETVSFAAASRAAAPPRLNVVGPRTSAIEVDVSRRAWTIGIRLRPGALPLLARCSAPAFTDRCVPAVDVWPAWASAIADIESGDGGAQETCRALFTFLRALLPEDRSRAWDVRAFDRMASDSHGGIPVARAADRMGMAARTLRKRWLDATGMSPKRSARIRRLYRAIEASRTVDRDGWTRVALASGYADQSHLVREFRALLGETPEAFRRRGPDRAETFKPPR